MSGEWQRVIQAETCDGVLPRRCHVSRQYTRQRRALVTEPVVCHFPQNCALLCRILQLLIYNVLCHVSLPRPGDSRWGIVVDRLGLFVHKISRKRLQLYRHEIVRTDRQWWWDLVIKFRDRLGQKFTKFSTNTLLAYRPIGNKQRWCVTIDILNSPSVLADNWILTACRTLIESHMWSS